jgi:tRNA threonylcarbamoyladenosine biosynthesis protein TsaE
MHSNSSDRHKANKRACTSRSLNRPGPVPVPWQLVSSSQQHTDRLGQAIGRTLRGGETIALYGPLGAGKTALVRGIAQGLGAESATVSSPTFVMIHEYHGRLPLAHVDLYRVRSPRDLESTGLVDYFSGATVIAIEWADKGAPMLPSDRLEIELSHRAPRSRVIRLRATGPISAGLFTHAKTSYGAGRAKQSTVRPRPSTRKERARL